MSNFIIKIYITESEQEVIEIEADDIYQAKSLAMIKTGLRAGGRLVRFFDVISDEEIFARC